MLLLKTLRTLAVASLLISPAVASAHEVATDGTITVTMHIDPDDAPKAASPQTLLFYVADTTNAFKYSNCDCSVTITGGSDPAVASPPNVVNEGEATLPYTFNTASTYKVTLAGTPKIEGDFTPFTVSYEVPVVANPALNKSAAKSRTLIIAIGGGVAIVFVVLVGLYLWRERRV